MFDPTDKYEPRSMVLRSMQLLWLAAFALVLAGGLTQPSRAAEPENPWPTGARHLQRAPACRWCRPDRHRHALSRRGCRHRAGHAACDAPQAIPHRQGDHLVIDQIPPVAATFQVGAGVT